MLRLLIIAVVAFLVFKGSTFGWRPTAIIESKSDKVDLDMRQRLNMHVMEISNNIGQRNIFTHYQNLEDVARYITQTFQDYGYQVQIQAYNAYNKLSKNIIATRPGIVKSMDYIVIGAHYDTVVGSPGADDNASSIAVLLELARIFKDKDTNPSLKFVAFTNEEPPFFKSSDMGSFFFVSESLRNKDKITAAVILESVGFYSNQPFSQRYPPLFGCFYPNRANFIAGVSNFKSRHLLKKIKQGFPEESIPPLETVTTFDFVPGVDFSDNWSFWQEGIAAIMVTDTAFYRNPRYHTDTDTFDKLNYDYLTELTEALGVSINGLLNRDF